MCGKICGRLLSIYFFKILEKKKEECAAKHAAACFTFFSKQVIAFLKHVIYRPDYRVCLLH